MNINSSESTAMGRETSTCSGCTSTWSILVSFTDFSTVHFGNTNQCQQALQLMVHASTHRTNVGDSWRLSGSKKASGRFFPQFRTISHKKRNAQVISSCCTENFLLPAISHFLRVRDGLPAPTNTVRQHPSAFEVQIIIICIATRIHLALAYTRSVFRGTTRWMLCFCWKATGRNRKQRNFFFLLLCLRWTRDG